MNSPKASMNGTFEKFHRMHPFPLTNSVILTIRRISIHTLVRFRVIHTSISSYTKCKTVTLTECSWIGSESFHFCCVSHFLYERCSLMDRRHSTLFQGSRMFIGCMLQAFVSFQNNITIVTNWVPNEVSSTLARRLISRHFSVKYLLDDFVIEYIKKFELYGATNQT